VPCVTSAIYPTLLQIVGVTMPNQPPLDGINLVPLIDGKMTARPKPIGFWDYPQGSGHPTPSAALLAELLEAQQAGREVDPDTFGKDAGKITKQYPLDEFPGHAAWLDWPWKLHRIQKKGSPKLELYDLARDPYEKNDLAPQQADRAGAMRADLEAWMTSVVRSLNGQDYR